MSSGANLTADPGSRYTGMCPWDASLYTNPRLTPMRAATWPAVKRGNAVVRVAEGAEDIG